MNRFLKFILSMPFMSLLVLVFFLAISIATGVETYYDTITAKYYIYNAKWFEWVIFLLSINLISNIFKYKMYKREKIGSFLFHLSFLMIVLGAYITRNYSYEGIMTIREDSASNVILSSETYFQIRVDDQEKQYSHDMPIMISDKLMNAKSNLHHKLNSFGLGGVAKEGLNISTEFNFPDESHLIEINYHDFLPKLFQKDTFQIVEAGEDVLHIVTVGEAGRKNNYLKQGAGFEEKGIIVTNNLKLDQAAVSITTTDSGDFIMTPFELDYFQMRDQSQGKIPKDTLVPFLPMRLYSYNGVQFVYKQKLKNVELIKINEVNHPMGENTLQVKVKDGSKEKIVNLLAESGVYPRYEKFELNGLNYYLGFGAKTIGIPFFVHLRDFQLEKYPGTDNPSSYASEVILMDTIKNVEFEHRIFMNNVLDYDGYRFFQSSFDPDEKGTILSVNHDWWGTNVTYLGYFLMMLGMFIAVFAKGSRFVMLMGKAKSVRLKRENLKIILPLLMMMSGSLMAQESDSNEVYIPINKVHAESFGKLIIQDFGGRFKPVQTIAEQVVKKINRSDTYDGQSAIQVFVGLHTDFGYWFDEPIVYVSGDSTKKVLGIDGSRAKMKDFYNEETGYKLTQLVKNAMAKAPGQRNAFDKDFIKTDERFNILRGVVMGYHLKIFPIKNDPNNKWFAPADNLTELKGDDSTFVSSIMTMYVMEVRDAKESGDWTGADEVISLIRKYQRGIGDANVIPSEEKLDWEIFYNKADIFERLNYTYLLIGFFLLIIQFIHLFKPKFKVKKINKVGVVVFILLAALHAFALGLRWYLSGHAPWSNGYEAIVFISFITVIAGLLFSKNSKIVLGATGILAWLMLFVAHMNNMDPQITNLVPVLKSYWLMIHVAVITGSYGFLGLSAILGVVNMLIEIFKTKKTKKQMSLTSKELRYVSEMVMTIGLFMLTIGTFLGGIWANESWGRYWGWDAKETWALASVLVYTIILHFRFIPGLKSDFTFNLWSFWGYSSIIMTFYGVNFYLSGLHSYATGDPVPIPNWVPITVSIFLLLSLVSFIRKRRVL